MEGTEIRDRSVGRVIFQAARDSFCEVVTELEIGREDHALVDAGAVKRAIQRGIEGQVPATDFLVHDGTDLPGPGVARKCGALIADFIRQTYTHRPVPRLRNAEERVAVFASPLAAAIGLNAGENVEAGLEPVGNGLRDFHGLVFGT